MAFFKGDEDEVDERSDDTAEATAVPLLPLREVVVFPHMVVPLFVGREKSVRALEYAMQRDRVLLLSAQTDAKADEPTADEINKIGTLGAIVQLVRLPDGTVKVLVEGKRRVRILDFESGEDFLLAKVEDVDQSEELTIETEALMRSVNSTFESYVKLNKKVPPEMVASVAAITDAARLSDTVAAHLNLDVEEKQRILEIASPRERLEEIYTLMQGELDVLQVETRIRSRVKKQMERSQKEYYLNEQMRAIQKELGDRDEFKNEVDELDEKLKAKDLPEQAHERCEKEIKKLKMMSPMSAEATVVRNYIDWILSLPWNETKDEKTDVSEAAVILDEDHYGLEKPKERILEYLAVRVLAGEMKGPIICFVGPPGVGKTSLGRSIARATGRDFVRISLGGVRDEAEIRGHRRTYIGALPGKIVHGLKKAGTGNPVFLLDEVDKMSTDFRGDPSSALLEVLDPEQNKTFEDHYLDLETDLSKVLFITTANTLGRIPPALQDRMEIIHLPGYIEEEKLQIARKFLVPKQVKEHGLVEGQLEFSDQGILEIIRYFTKEAGVRSLEREIASICRKIAREVVADSEFKAKIGPKQVRKHLGNVKYRFGTKEDSDQVGIATGLAFTELGGGDLLTIEALVTSGKGRVQISGRLGDVMQESAQAAISYVRRRAKQLGLARDFYQKVDIHVHVPEGAVPKDGPSAGITMAVAVTSALTGMAVRSDIAMTGEITLRGRILPIGGLKEKLIAALRGGVEHVLIPKENERDLKEISAKVKRRLNLILVENMDQVLEHALVAEDRVLFHEIVEYPLEEIFGVEPTVEAPAGVN